MPCAVDVYRTQSGAVSRLQLEQWLQKDGRELLLMVDGATILDLLILHTYGEDLYSNLHRIHKEALRMLVHFVTEYLPGSWDAHCVMLHAL